MVRYLNPGGHDYGTENNDGYGISLLAFAIVYTIIFLAGCVYVWLHRHNPVIRMRKINLALISILTLHVYLIIVLIVYPLNGKFPCGVEFWVMSIYLPIGIGLFQAQNQQLLIVSREQNQLIHVAEAYKPMVSEKGHGVGTPRYWAYRFKLWWNSTSRQGKYESFVFAGIVIQVSRCRRGS